VYQEISLCSEKDCGVLEKIVVFSKRLLCSPKDCCVLQKIVAFQKRNWVVFCPYGPPYWTHPKIRIFLLADKKMNAQQKWKLQSSTHSILLPARMAAPSLWVDTGELYKQEDLLDLITALWKIKCLLTTTVATQCTFQSSPWWFFCYCRHHITWSTQTVLLHHQS